MDLLNLFAKNYEQIRVSGFESKYLPFLKLKNYVAENFPAHQVAGKSFLGNEIFYLKTGSGKIHVLAWSQMHGNESTGTRCMFDVFEFLKLPNEWCREIIEKITLHFIPMLNPDGATLYARRNACGIDINRDFIREASPEIKVLKSYARKIQPDFLFNLHDQRTIFNVSETAEPATLSFLAPSADAARSLTETRRDTMAVIAHICNGLSKFIPEKTARFSDEFYPASTGDNFTKMGIPTILFEAGHYPQDYQRDHTRRFNALAVLLALDGIAGRKNNGIENYFEIPENNKKFLDIVLRNVLVKSNESETLMDIGIYFEEKLNKKKQEIEFCARVEEAGDLSGYFGHLDIDKKGKVFVGKSSLFPVVGETADFSVGNIHFDKGKFSG